MGSVNTRNTPNAQQVPIKVVGGSQYGRFSKINTERTYNMYKSVAGEGESAEEWLIGFPGYQRVLNILPAGQGRALYNCIRGNFLVAVVNQNVYIITPLLAVTLLGTLSTLQGEVFIAENLNQQIVLVDGTNAYIYYYGSPASALTVLTLDTNLVPNYVEYHNTFFLFGNGATTPFGSQWFVYSPDAMSTTVLDLTKVLALQTKADYAIAVKRLPGQGNNVLVFGSTVAEIWTQVGGLSVYLRNPTKNIDYGCVSVATISESDNYIAWLAANQDNAPVIMIYDGNQARRISTDGIDYQLSQIQFPAQSTAILYRIDGHLFYQLTFFNAVDNMTFLYDFNTELFFNLSDQFLNYHPARQIVYFGLTQYFCSLNNGSIYELNSNTYVIDENLQTDMDPDPELVYDLQRMRICPSVREANSTRFIANSIVLTLEQGTDPNYMGATHANYIVDEDSIGDSDIIITENGQSMITENSPAATTDGAGDWAQTYYRPKIELAISKDGGVTWGNYVTRNLHQLGFRKNILHWESLGVANDLTIKVRVWSRGRIILNNGLLDIIS